MTKEQLKVKYGEEKVLCVRNKNIERNKTLNYKDIVKYYGYLDYRYNAEVDFTAKQVIPYIVIKSDDKIFVTKRIQGDSRLVGGYSIGMGGHINPEDVYLHRDNLIDANTTIGNCIYRELTEETTVDTSDIKSVELVDSFIDTSNEVSSVHMCLLYVLDATGVDVNIKETDKLDGSFMTVEEVRDIYDNLENWSKISFDKLFPTILSVDVAEDATMSFDEVVVPKVSTRRIKKVTETTEE